MITEKQLTVTQFFDDCQPATCTFIPSGYTGRVIILSEDLDGPTVILVSREDADRIFARHKAASQGGTDALPSK